MARLVGGVVGAGLGSLVGMPSLGFALGSGLGGLLEPSQVIKQQGQRITDLKVSSSASNSPIPMIFGTVRKDGVLIQSSDKREYKNVKRERAGGKGGGQKVEYTDYSYYVDLAFALGKGELSSLNKVYVNNTLKYDFSLKNNGYVGELEQNVTFYDGSETQLPDPTLQLLSGNNKTPAYRGTSYVVIKDFSLNEYGGGIPNFTFEVSKSNYDNKVHKFDLFAEGLSSGNVYYNPINKMIYSVRELTSQSLYSLSKIDVFSREVVMTNNKIPAYTFQKEQISFLPNGDLLVNVDHGDVNDGGELSFKIIDQNTLQIKKEIRPTTPLLNSSSTPKNWNHYTNQEGKSYWTGLTTFGRPPYKNIVFFELTLDIKGDLFINKEILIDYSYDASFWGYYSSASPLDQISNSSNGGLDKGYPVFDKVTGKFFWLKSTIRYKNTNNSALFLMSYNSFLNYVEPPKLLKHHSNTRPNQHSYIIYDIKFDEISRNLYLFYVHGTSHELYLSIAAYNIDTNQIISDIDILKETSSPPYRVSSFDSVHRRFIITTYANHSYNYYYYLDTHKFESVYLRNNVWGSRLPNNICAFIPELSCEVCGTGMGGGAILLNYGDRFDKGTYRLDLLILDLLKETTINLSLVDVSELSDIVVRGYEVNNTIQIKDVISNLSVIYNFDVVIQDFKIVFKKRNTNIKKVISTSELSASKFSKDLVFDSELLTTSEIDLMLPKTVNVSYYDINKELMINTQETTVENVDTRNVENIEFNVAMNADEAKQISERLMYEKWVNRYTYSFSTNYDHIDLNPSDVIRIVSKNNDIYTMRIVSKDMSEGIIRFNAISTDSAVYEQFGKGEEGKDLEQNIPIISSTKLFYLDIPILRNSDDDAGVYVTCIPNNSRVTWTGASILTSDKNNGVYVEQAKVYNSSVTGSTINALGEPLFLNGLDTNNKIRVITTEDLNSISEEQLNNGYNLALIGREIVQFKNAILVDENIYELDTFYRGLYGTESYFNSHSIGEDFILLSESSNSIERVLRDEIYLNTNMFFKAVTFKNNVNNTSYQNLTNTGVGLMCYPVDQVEFYKSTSKSFVIRFKKRVRGLGYMVNDRDVFDLDEDKYEIDIYKNSEFNENEIVRTIKLTDSTSFLYTLSQQNEDFGFEQNSLNFIIYKMNKIIGRGYGKKSTISI